MTVLLYCTIHETYNTLGIVNTGAQKYGHAGFNGLSHIAGCCLMFAKHYIGHISECHIEF